MRHIRVTSGMKIAGSGDKKALAQSGYFHGYKGYRYAGHSGKRIPYTEFAELRAVIRFDTQLKAILYPLLMNLEMTMKNLALVEMLNAADSSRLVDVYSRIMPGDKKGKRAGKLEVIHASNEVLLQSYKRNNVIVRCAQRHRLRHQIPNGQRAEAGACSPGAGDRLSAWS